MEADCPLCARGGSAYFKDAARGWSYRSCSNCGLVYREEDGLLGAVEERRRYSLHQNDPGQAGYRNFLEPMAEAILRRLEPGGEGLDYGCGPGPVLALMLGERGMKMALHDPHFAPAAATLERRYDFVTCTEAAEHFRDPAADFSRIAGLLKPGGWLGVMTRLLSPGQDFSRWHYRLDPTHIRFFTEQTLRWLSRRHGWRLERPGEHLALFQRA